MKIEQSHHVDASEQDAEGNYDWYYEYDMFRFTDGERTLVARSYTDTGTEAHFLRFEVQSKPVLIRTEDTDNPLLRRSAEYLKSIGKVGIKYLGPEGYEPLPTEA